MNIIQDIYIQQRKATVWRHATLILPPLRHVMLPRVIIFDYAIIAAADYAAALALSPLLRRFRQRLCRAADAAMLTPLRYLLAYDDTLRHYAATR